MEVEEKDEEDEDETEGEEEEDEESEEDGTPSISRSSHVKKSRRAFLTKDRLRVPSGKMIRSSMVVYEPPPMVRDDGKEDRESIGEIGVGPPRNVTPLNEAYMLEDSNSLFNDDWDDYPY
ncbi:hypothetical protein Dimus_001120 [Dionaea muscipula]